MYQAPAAMEAAPRGDWISGALGPFGVGILSDSESEWHVPKICVFGALPFRVWEIYSEMVKSLKAQRVDRFVSAAGLMAHYVGDACQPLHISRLHHGSKESESAVHEVYETRMLDRFRKEVVQRLNAELQSVTVGPTVKGGYKAACRIVDLMRETIEALPPQEVLDVFNDQSAGDLTGNMWDKLGPRTITRLAAGARALAELWESAWKEGNGKGVPNDSLSAVDQGTLMTLYNYATFLQSRRLDEMSL